MNKHKLHHVWVKIRPISYWYFFAAFVISASVSLLALRDNNLTAIKLHNQLTQVDKDDGDVSLALNNLRNYIYSHMNTNLASGPNSIYPPIQLEYTYQRLVAAQEAEQASQDTNTQLYTEAEDYCQKIIPTGFSGRYRISCIENYITSHGSSSGSSSVSIPSALYEFDFISPFWSPDFAGWSIVVTLLLFIMFVVRFVLEKWLKYQLKEHA